MTTGESTPGHLSPCLRSLDEEQSKQVDYLLTLPAADFYFGNKKSEPHASSHDAEDDDDSDELLLVQLPVGKGVSVSDLLSGTARIIGKTVDDVYDEEEEEGASRQACLVVEKTGQSYSLSRSETSNAYVLVPPQQVKSDATVDGGKVAGDQGTRADENADPVHRNTTEAGCKRRKMTHAIGKLVPMKARLMAPPGGASAGASFLQLTQRTLRQSTLSKKVSRHVYNPYEPSSSSSMQASQFQDEFGWTAKQLALDLGFSILEVKRALSQMRTFFISSNIEHGESSSSSSSSTTNRYGVLAEEAAYDTKIAIVSVLAEVDDCSNYASQEIPVKRCVEEVRQRLAEMEGTKRNAFNNAMGSDMVRHCLWTLSLSDTDILIDSDSMILLDVKKIACFLAHHLFNRKRGPWLQSDFVHEWESIIPGVGDAYKPDLKLLKGVALYTPAVLDDATQGDKHENGSGYLKYFPESKLPFEPKARFRRLFAEREQWTLDELLPYVARVTEEGDLTQSEVLLKYTRVVNEEKDGKVSQMYMTP